ncbi:hypothetical protein EGW08_009155, partial [Elysia chlorotica]
GAEVTELWYDEIKDYNWDDPGFSMNTGHFTQLVWKACTHLGIGRSQSTSSGLFVYVANYSPAGNMLGAFQENVLPLQA